MHLVRTPPVIGARIIDMLIVWNSLLRKVRSWSWSWWLRRLGPCPGKTGRALNAGSRWGIEIPPPTLQTTLLLWGCSSQKQFWWRSCRCRTSSSLDHQTYIFQSVFEISLLQTILLHRLCVCACVRVCVYPTKTAVYIILSPPGLSSTGTT